MYNLHNSGRHDGAVGLEFFFDIVVGPRLRAVAHKQVGRSVVSTSCIRKCAQIHVYIYKIRYVPKAYVCTYILHVPNGQYVYVPTIHV